MLTLPRILVSLASLGVLLSASAAHTPSSPEQIALYNNNNNNNGDAAPVHTLDGWGYDNCGTEIDALQIESITLSPDPPKAGKALTVTLKGSVQETIEEGAWVNVVVKLGLIKILSRRFDLCEEARKANATVQCPVKKGDYEITHTVTLAREIPPAKFTIEAVGYTESDEDMACLKINVDFTKATPRCV